MLPIHELAPRPAVFRGVKGNVVLTAEGQYPAAAQKKVAKWLEVMAEAYEEATGRTVDLSKLPVERQNLLAGLCETLSTHHKAATSLGAGRSILDADANVAGRLGIKESVTTADIATFTTQQLAYIVDVFAPFIIQDVVTTILMTGPTAYVHRQTFRREDGTAGSGHYGSDSALVDGLDPSYSDCPTECGDANGIDFEVTAETVEADCSRLAGTYCVPANYHYSSQYGGDIATVLMEGITIELRRAIQAKILTAIVANAGATHIWNRTPAAGYFASAHPREWRQELWNTVRDANKECLNATDGRIALSKILGDVESIAELEKTVPVEFADGQDGDLIKASGSEKTSYYGTTKVERFSIYRFLEGMATDTMVLMPRDDRDPAFVYLPWIPITSLGMWMNPEKAEVKLGALTLYGMAALRSGRIQHISIGA